MGKFIVAPDSFKESLAAREVARRIAAGIKRALPDAEVKQVPLSDGGEGLVDTLVAAAGGKVLSREVTGPLGEKVSASFGLLDDGETAVIEMAAASGLALVPPAKRNPMHTTTYGTGELIKAALDEGCRRIILGIGGSATNDGGAGMARALGIRLLNSRGEDIPPGAAGLLELARIDASGLDRRLQETEILVACDVTNPLCGPAGAAYVYGLQKGATRDMLPLLDRALDNLAEVVARDLGKSIRDLPGAGAAGGMGGGLVAFAGGKLCPGLPLVLRMVKFEELLSAGGVELVITGEGEINAQTTYGKVPVGVAQVAKKFGLPVLAIVGSIGPGTEGVYGLGIDAIMSIIPRPMSLEEAMRNAGELLEDAAFRAARLFALRCRVESHVGGGG